MSAETETCCCGASHTGNSIRGFRTAHETCRLAWADTARAQQAAEESGDNGTDPGDVTSTGPISVGFIQNDLPIEHRREDIE